MSTIGRAEQEGSAALAQSVAHSLDQVREILFGPQHREFARRLARTEARIAAQAEELRNETRRRLEMLEAHIRKESEALTTLIESERSAQVEALDRVTRESHETSGSLEQRVRRLEEAMARAQHDFRQQVLEQAKSFIDEIQRTRDELNNAVQRGVVAALSDAGEGLTGPSSTSEEACEEERWERSSEAA